MAIFGLMFVLYFVCQAELLYHVCCEALYFFTFYEHVMRCLPRVPLLVGFMWPVVGYVFAEMTIRAVEWVLWVVGELVHLFILGSALLWGRGAESRGAVDGGGL
jgi:hypothetical protein